MTDEYELREIKHRMKHSEYSRHMNWLDGAFYSWYGGRRFGRNQPVLISIKELFALTIWFGIVVAFSYLPLLIMKFILMGGTLLGILLIVWDSVNKTFFPSVFTLMLGSIGYYYQYIDTSAHAFTGFHELDKIVYITMIAVAVLAMIRRVHNRYVWKYLDHIGRKYNIVVNDWFGV